MADAVTVIGLKEANAALKKLPDFVKIDVQPETEVTAFQIAQRAQQLAPVDTGLLQSRIVWEPRPRSVMSVVGVLESDFDDDSPFYWVFQEYGTVNHAAQPFMRPAGDALRDDHHARILRALEKSAQRVEADQKSRI